MSHAVPTVQDVVLMVLDTLGEVYYGTATGGTTTTVVDSDIANMLSEDTFNFGMILVTDTTDDLAPKGEMRFISDFADDDGTITVPVAFSAAPGTGDRYAVADSRWTIEQIIGGINRGLVAIGDMPQLDVSLTTSGRLTRYTLPSGVNKRNLAMVYIQELSTTDDELPLPSGAYSVRADDELVFAYAPASGKVIELHYDGPHVAVEALADALDTQIALDRIVAETTYQLMRSRIRSTDGGDRELIQIWNDIKEELNIARRRHPVKRTQPVQPPLMRGWGFRGTSRRRRSGKYGPWLIS